MNEEFYKNNMIKVHGEIVGTPDYSHSVGSEKFLKGNIRVLRTSGQTDTLPFMVSERLAPDWTLGDGDKVMLIGQLRSHNVWLAPNGKSRLEVMIFVRDIKYVFYTDDEIYATKNDAALTGHLCKPTVYRVTPFGREICDMMLAVKRAFDKTDYIPCIAWGRTARYAETLKVGDKVKITGRFQSRDYQKKLESGAYENRTAYEVSVFELIN